MVQREEKRKRLEIYTVANSEDTALGCLYLHNTSVRVRTALYDRNHVNWFVLDENIPPIGSISYEICKSLE